VTKKKKHEHHNGSQKGKPTSDAKDAGNNVMSKEELEKAIHPTRTSMDDG